MPTVLFLLLNGQQIYNYQYAYLFLNGTVALIGNKCIPTTGITSLCVRLTEQGQDCITFKSEGSGAICLVIPWTGQELLDQLLSFQHLNLLICKMERIEPTEQTIMIIKLVKLVQCFKKWAAYGNNSLL